MNNDDFTILVSGGGRHRGVSVWTVCPSHSKWLSEESNESAWDFELSLDIPLWKLFGWFRRLQLWATGDWQLHHNNMHLVSCRAFGKTPNHPGDSATHHSSDLVPCDFWLFPKLKSPLKGNRFQIINEIQENTTGQLTEIGRTVWGPSDLLWRGLRGHCPMYNVCCMLYLFQ